MSTERAFERFKAARRYAIRDAPSLSAPPARRWWGGRGSHARYDDYVDWFRVCRELHLRGCLDRIGIIYPVDEAWAKHTAPKPPIEKPVDFSDLL